MARPRKVTEHLDTSKRPSRIPVDGPRKLLEIPGGEDPAYHYTWQPEGEVPRFLRAGYEYVTDPGFVGDPTVNKSSKIGAPGNVLMVSYKTTPLYALRQPIEFWEEDQQVQEDARLKQEEAMQPDQADGEYGKVTIKSRLGGQNMR